MTASRVLVNYARTSGALCTGFVRSPLGDTPVRDVTFAELCSAIHTHLAKLPEGSDVIWFRQERPHAPGVSVDPAVVHLLRTDPDAAVRTLSALSTPSIPEVIARLQKHRKGMIRVWCREERMECVGCGRWVPKAASLTHSCGIRALPFHLNEGPHLWYLSKFLLLQPCSRFYTSSTQGPWITAEQLRRQS
jgi:hypothetical protein